MTDNNDSREQDLLRKAIILEKNLDLKDRRSGLRTYKNTFLGCECVNVILDLQFAHNINEAIDFGTLLIQYEFIKHVSRKYKQLKNEDIYYKFTKTYAAKNNLVIPEDDDISFTDKLANDISTELDKEFDEVLNEFGVEEVAIESA